MLTLCTLSYLCLFYSVFHVILLPFLCSHCIYSFTVFTLCTHSCITRAYQYQSINQSIKIKSPYFTVRGDAQHRYTNIYARGNVLGLCIHRVPNLRPAISRDKMATPTLKTLQYTLSVTNAHQIRSTFRDRAQTIVMQRIDSAL